VPLREQQVGQVGAEKAGRAGNENAHHSSREDVIWQKSEASSQKEEKAKASTFLSPGFWLPATGFFRPHF
jgi:hypothetical protein